MLTFKDGKELKQGDLFCFEQNYLSIVPIEIYPLYATNYNNEEFISGLHFGERIGHQQGDNQSKIDECPLIFEYLGNGKCKETISGQTLNILCDSEECLPMYGIDFYKANNIDEFETKIQDTLECPLAVKVGQHYDGGDIVQVDEIFKQKNGSFQSNSGNYLNDIKSLREVSEKSIKDDIQNVVQPALYKLGEMNKALNHTSKHI